MVGENIGSVRALARAARDPRMRRATRDVIASLGTAVIAIAALLDPEVIVVGGGAIGAGDALLRRVRRHVPRELSRARLVRAGLGPASPVYGALWGAEAVRRRRVVAGTAVPARGRERR